VLERIAPLIPALVERDYDSMTNLRSGPGLERAFRSLPTTESTGASVIFFDIVGLSAYNHERGTPEADRLIRHIAKILRPPQVPEAAISARLGGGHFACLLPRHDAERFAARVKAGTAGPRDESSTVRPRSVAETAADLIAGRENMRDLKARSETITSRPAQEMT